MKAKLKKIAVLCSGVLTFFLPALAAASVAPLAFFPVQDLSQGRNGINMAFTEYLANRLEESGTEVSRLDTIISFMANNRLREVGQLETFHIDRVREELGASYVLLGTIVQNKETSVLAQGVTELNQASSASLGVTLNLIRTYDGRTIWSYSGAYSTGDVVKLLGIGELTSFEGLQALLSDEILAAWPQDMLKQEKQSAVSIDSVILQPLRIVPGTEMQCRVRLRNLWLEGRAPRAFVKADDQIYAANFSPGDNSYEVSWIAGEKDGRFPVTLILEWPLYGRMETLALGFYLVDSVQPVLAVDLKGESMQGKIPIFNDRVVIVPDQLVYKPLSHWRFTVLDKDDLTLAIQDETGDLPEALVWKGASSLGGYVHDGVYRVLLEIWDETGYYASAEKEFELRSKAPVVEVSAQKEGQNVMLDLGGGGKIPLAFWRLEMWSEEDTLLTTAEGQELPAQIGIELPAEKKELNIEGSLVVKDILGNRRRQKIKDLFKQAKPEAVVEEKTATKAWVDEF